MSHLQEGVFLMQKSAFSDEAGNNWRRNSLYFEPEEESGSVVVAAELLEVPFSLSNFFG